ncbi:Cytochrome P450 6B3 [Acromyrmex echinatior]|uniref:Cytochrome P450 6B3 n=1 Tax=Acromyrmex echinatior TaxID=103372 RepID=F4WF97_ACREC|nr:Cytochrome P450 6B3 [Acromyrmex echinatior]
MEDRYVPPFCSCGCHAPRPIKPIELPPHEPCCCCEYNPFSDNSKESEIYDLPFALRKLTVMKCQMKKWRMERLQLESENRSLKQALQSFGVKPDGVLGTDPSLVHYREENERLQNANEELAEKVRNLEESLAERDCCDDPCEKVKYVREKIAALRDRFAAEKKQMRDTISHLKLKLMEAEEDTSCAALNRLRAKLRELMKDGQKADQQVSVVVERSMQTSVDLSKSYEDLLRTERLQAEPTQIRRTLEEVVTFSEEIDVPLSAKEEDIPALLSQLRNCKMLLAELKMHLDEKTAYTEALQSELNKLKASIVIPMVDLDEMIVRSAMDEVAEMKEEPEKPDKEIRKIQELSRVQEEDNEMKSEIDKLNVDLRREEEKFQVAQKELEGMRDDLHSLGAENEFLKETLENAKLETNELKEENVALKNNLDNMIKELESSRRENNNIKTDLDQLLSENKYLRDELEKQVAETDQLKSEGIAWKEGFDKLLQEMDRLKVESDKLKDESATVKSERDNLTTERDNLKSENGLLKDDLSKINVALDDAKKQLNKFEVENEVLTEELKKANVNNNKLLADFDTLQSEMAKLKSENRKLLQEVDDGKEELTKLLSEIETLKKEVDNMSNKLTSANNEVVDLQQKSVELNNKLKEAQVINEQLRADIHQIEAENKDINAQMNNYRDENSRLNIKLNESKEQINLLTDEVNKLREQLDNAENRIKFLEAQLVSLQTDKDKMQNEINALQNEISKLKLDLSAESTAKRDIQEELVALKNEMKNLILKIDEMRVQNHALKEERDLLKKELLNLGEESLSLRAANAEMMNQINNLKLDISDLQSQLSKAEEDIEYWKLENCKLKMSTDKLSIENEKKKEALNVCKVEHQTLEKEITNLRNEKIKLEGEIAELKNLLEGLNLSSFAEKSAKEEAVKELTKFKNEVVALREELQTLKSELTKLRTENDKIRDKEEKLSSQVSTLKTELENAKNEILALRVDNDTLKSKINTLTDENNKLKSESNMLISEVDGLKLENTNMREERQKFEKEFDKLKGEDDGQKDEIKNLKSNLTAEQKLSEKIRLELSTSQSENDRLRAELEKLQKNLDTLELVNDKLNSEVEDLKKTSIDAQNKVNALQYHVAELLEEKEALLKELDSLRAEVSRLGKVVSDKVAKEAIEKKTIDSNGKLIEELKAELDKMRVENENLKRKLNDVNKQHISLKDENAALKIENTKIATELDSFKSDLNRCRVDNERLTIELAASEARALEIQRERTDDKERQDLQNLMVENKELRDKLRMAQNEINKLKENIKKSKGDFIEDADDIDSFENELKKSMIEIDKAREDLKYAAEENNKLKMINDGLELELSQLKALLDEIKDYPEQIDEEVNGTKDQSQRLLAALKIKNMELKSGLDHCQAEKEHLNDEINNLSEKIKFLQSLSPIEAGVIKPDECGDFVKANELLKKQIEKQYDAVQRVRDYIQFMDGKIPVRPEMATTLDDDFEIERWIVPSIVELLKESQKLSENICLAEIEVQNIDKLLNECKKENENYIKQLLELGVEVTKVAGVDNGDKLAAFDPESWLKSLTLMQLAELHDKICLLTSNMVQDSPAVCDCSMINRDYGSDRLRADYDASNRRIAALQKKIVEKQIKAGWKLQELRRTLRIEQANLIQISERITLEKRRNVTFQLTTNDSVHHNYNSGQLTTIATGMFEILCTCVVILYLLYYYLTADFDYWTSCGINGPKPIPFFGNIVEFLMGKKNLNDFFKEIYDRYPKESMVGVFLRGNPALVIKDPEYIKQVLIKDFTIFAERHSHVYEKAVRWRSLRTRLSPIFTTGKLKDMFHLLLNCSDHFEKYLDEIVSKDSIVECRHLTSKFTIDVIGSCVFGLEMNALKEENNQFQRMGHVTDEFIAAQLFVFFAAGFETSSITMSLAMYELAQNQSIQEKVRKEIKEVLDSTDGVILYDNIKKMNYLEKIYQEVLRKYPPVTFLMRQPTKNYTFEGTKITLRKGQVVIIPNYAIQHDPNIYPDPEVFDPERFSEENVKQRNPMYYLPFGDGPRNCIGKRFATNQTKVGLIKVLMNHKIDVCEMTQIPLIHSPWTNFLFQITHGVYVKLTKLD